MRLNDPQIELVHDDPFMGYIETAPTQSDTGAATSIRRRAPLDSIADGEDTPSAAADDDVDVEEVDVGDESSRHPPPPAPPLPASPRVSDSVASASSDRITDGAAAPINSSAAATDPSIVIVLLVE